MADTYQRLARQDRRPNLSEIVYANHLGHFALIQELIPHLEVCTDDSRIIIVSSSLCKSGKIDLNKRDFIYNQRVIEPGEKKPSFAPTGYCDSKLMNMLTCHELDGSNIITYAVSPGFCSSELGRNVQTPIYKIQKGIDDTINEIVPKIITARCS